jgi:hypothetical protein
LEAERWRRVEELYHSALLQNPEERALFVLQSCEGDEALRQEVESLLAEVDAHDTFLEVPAIELAGRDLGLAAERDKLPLQIGRYRIVGILGEGGMGLVYEAEQDQPRRSVALKVIKPGFATVRGVRRFEDESKALGRLQHPGIAQIYEASAADAGFGKQPYFAMELIRGQSLSHYAEERRLDHRQKLALTCKICEAMQHAHERGLVHRDLKPGNILVDETGQPKILDFGVARVTEGDTPATRQTDVGQIIGTLAYMSPEQVMASPDALDPRSDVYSIGVILYELLAGRLPHDISQSQLHDAMRVILEEDPPPLGSYNRQCRGDVEIIVGKALERDKNRRYSSAADLSADLQRYLNNEPITARRPTATYQFQKFARRNRSLVAGVAAVFLALAAGTVVSTQQAIRAHKAEQAALLQRDRAETEAKTADAVQKFIEDIFNTNSGSQADPVKARQTTARQLLDIGAHNIDTELKNAPAAKERMLGILSDLYYGLGLSDEAVGLDKKRVAVAKAAFGGNDPRVAAALSSLASSMHASRSVNEREAVLLEAKAILDKNHDFTSSTRGDLLLSLAEHYQSSDRQKALDFAGQAVALYRKMPAGTGLASALYQQGTIFNYAGDNVKAVAALSEAVETAQREGAARDPSLPMYAATLGEAHVQLLQYEPARQNLELAAKTARQLNGDEHVDSIETEARLGDFYCKFLSYKEGLAYLKHALDVCLKTKGPDDPFYTPQIALMYGEALANSGRLEEGLVFISRAVENRRKNRPETRYFAQMLSQQAVLLAELSDYKRARQNLDEAETISKKVGFANGSDYHFARLQLAFAANDSRQAAAVIESAYGPLEEKAELSLGVLRNLLSRAELALLNKDAVEAARLSKRASDLITASSVRSYLKSWEARAALDEGSAYLLLHRAADALPCLRRAVKLTAEMYDATSVRRVPAEAALGIAYAQLGDSEMAAKCLVDVDHLRRLHRQLGEQFERPVRTLQQSLGTRSAPQL